ncbi:7050_t:CDS:1 [Diversispora eburnea]|uniref:7050_t:CDS:1 n=2 Tax=Diversisporales TaxID=214509 RepID=A0A9N8UYZ2_9GLOM|nr:7050_t:CDS:1 [Diversispora eburnea]
MSFYLPSDCLEEIFEYLDNDVQSLHSSVLVNRLWCKTAIRFLWRNPWKHLAKFENSDWASIVETLQSCISEEIKASWEKNKIENSKRQPLFDYVGYCRYLSEWEINKITYVILQKGYSKNNWSSKQYENNRTIIERDLFRLFLSRCSTLQHLILPYIGFTDFPEAKNCFAQLSVLECNVYTPSSIFSELAKYCQNLDKLIIDTCQKDNIGLATLIKAQLKLKNVVLRCVNIEEYAFCWQIGHALLSQRKSLTHFYLSDYYCIPVEILTAFKNLKVLHLYTAEDSSTFSLPPTTIYPKLEVLEIMGDFGTPFNYWIKLIENTQGTLTRIYWNFTSEPKRGDVTKYLQAIIRHCPKLKFVTILITKENESTLEQDLEDLFTSCVYLEGLKLQIACNISLNASRIFNLLKKLSLNNLDTLNLLNLDSLRGNWQCPPEDVKSFMDSYTNRKPLSIVLGNFLHMDEVITYNLIGQYRATDVLKDFYKTSSLIKLNKGWNNIGVLNK